jgi:hypothetical protein
LPSEAKVRPFARVQNEVCRMTALGAQSGRSA